jgi:hypothetical protein
MNTNTNTQNATATYRKTKTGEWVVFAPVAMLVTGCGVYVTKKDGTVKLEMIARVGKSFQVDGVAYAYGYILQTPKAAPSAPKAATTRSNPSRYICDECGEWVNAGSRCWETGCSH